MGRAFEYRKAAKLKRWGHMAKTPYLPYLLMPILEDSNVF